MENILAVLQSTEVQKFISAAENFIGILENQGVEEKKFYQSSHKALAELYTSGLSLPEIELQHTSSTTLGNDQIPVFVNKNTDAIGKLGTKAFYFEVFDPALSEENRTTQGWLVDDFADIYRDLKVELEKLKIGTVEAIEDALFHLKFSLTHHWGYHCVNAMRVMHYLKYDHVRF